MTKFSEIIRENAEPFWSETVNHKFVHELADGTLSKSAFIHYLVQDYAFFKHFADLLSYAIVYAPEYQQVHQLAGFLSDVTDGENDYFLRSFKELGVNEKEYLNPNLNPVMQGFADTITKATQTGYHDCLIVLSCAEWTYWTWANSVQNKRPTQFYFSEWITLHNYPDFGKFVLWLRSELDRLFELPEEEQRRLRDLFRHCCQLERDFFTYALVK